MSDERDNPQAIIAGNFELELALSTARRIKISGYIFASDNVAEINRRISDMQEVVELQAIRADVINKEAQVESLTQGIELHNETLSTILEKKEKGAKLATQERLTVERAETDTRNVKRQIDSLNAAIRAGKAKLKMNGATPG